MINKEPVSTQYNEYIQSPDLEHLSSYCPGGYHPVDLGDVFQERYRVVHKLGYGSYATVWLVKDLQCHSGGRFKALKVLSANASFPGKNREVMILRHLEKQKGEPSLELEPGLLGSGSDNVLTLFDDLVVHGVNGVHQCIVTELVGPNLTCIGTTLDQFYDDDYLPHDEAMEVVSGVACGVAFLHRSGVLHRDLHIGNICLYHPQMHEWTDDSDVLDYFGRTRKAYPLERWDKAPITPSELAHFPKQLMASSYALKLLELCLDSELIHVKICDFGEAILLDSITEIDELKTNIPCAYAAPELLFNDRALPSFASDIWALAIAFHWFLAGGSLFGYRSKDSVLRNMAFNLGKLPERWWAQWEGQKGFFDYDSGSPIISPNTFRQAPTGRLLRIAVSDDMDEGTLDTLETMARRMLCYNPEDRLSAEEVVLMIPWKLSTASESETDD